jgi:hypothetical protein
MEASTGLSHAAALSDRDRAFIAAGEARRMARHPQPAHAETVSYHGEVWTDGRGYATVRLPAGAHLLETPLDYELRDLEPAGTARVSAGLRGGRFTIATEQPHVKVAWRVTGQQGHRHQEEG